MTKKNFDSTKMFASVVFCRKFAFCFILVPMMILTASISAQPIIPLNRIAVNSSKPSEFIDTITRKTFYPEGNNYMYPVPSLGKGTFEFNVGPGVNAYNGAKAESALAQMQHDGYNVIRVFIQFENLPNTHSGPYWGIGGFPQKNTPDLSPEYLANFTDFLARANRHRIYVIPVLSYVPFTSFYQGLANANEPDTGNLNRFYLGSGAIAAKREYVKRFVAAIPLELRSTIFAYELENEVNLLATEPPFSFSSGFVTPANGRTFDMGSDVWRQECMDSSLVYWADTLSQAIRQVDSQAMVAASMFTYKAVGKNGPNGLLNFTDPRFPARPAVFSWRATGISYLSIHLYPLGSFYSIDTDLNSSEVILTADWIKKQPLLMGEFGASSRFYPDVFSAAVALQAHRISAYNTWSFAGSLLWTWDWPRNIDGSEGYPASESNGAINGALAPIMRVTASRSLASSYPYLAADGNEASSWISGGVAPQWVELDLGRVRPVSQATLVVEQSTPGRTTHVLEGRASTASSWVRIRIFDSITQAGQRLSHSLSPANNFRYIRVRTTRSRSWIAWREITID